MSGEFLNMKTKNGIPVKMLNLVDVVWIIESETLGEFRGFDSNDASKEYKPRWSRRYARRSPEVWSTKVAADAMEMIERVVAFNKNAYLVRMVRK
jgi:hypothetical protein